MEVVREITLGTEKQIERAIAKVLKEERRRRLETVDFQDNKLLLRFSKEKDYAIKTVVKQFSRKKYENQGDCISLFENTKHCKCFCTETVWKIITVVELPNIWITFFERYFGS